MEKKGFTLIELVIVVAIMGLLMTGIGQIIKLSSEAYSIEIEINDAMSGINPVIKRIQKRLIESSERGLKKPQIIGVGKTGEKYTKLKIKLPNENNDEYWYWFDTESKIIYRSEQDLEPINGETPDNNDIPLLRSKNDNWLSKNIEIKNFEYEFYQEGTTGKSEIWDSTTMSAINYVRIKCKLKGTLLGDAKSSNLKFSTGFKIE
ncbi:MAG: hypothetical protein B6I28_01520 [Fusobacteriia bacterium 4572_132]|nr:MAG: hypothetical protein B6I28_01520 [Fusobacteriia bacterium 4572_132]